MTLVQRLDEDLKIAIKKSDSLKVSVLRLAKAAVKNREIEKRSALSEDDVLSVLSTLTKQRKESIEQFSKGGRIDLVEKEKQELLILQSYLPRQLTQEELDKIITDAINEASANSMKDIGKVMRIVMPRVKGAADGKVVNNRVKELLEKM